jgi:tetratricopeptide (TPR) repeat protein
VNIFPLDPLQITFLILTALTGVASRRPFLHFPMDDDFSIYTYRARFANRGFQWKKDLQIIGIPMWRMLLQDKLYGNPETGVQRIRTLQTFFHVAGSLTIFFAILFLTDNSWAALIGGCLHAFYGTSPDLTAGSFNHEQFYTPFTLLGFTLLTVGPETVFWAGLCFGLATIPKFTTGLYPAVLSLVVGFQYGLVAMAVFAGSAAFPVIISNLIDKTMGFWDDLSRKQMQTRMATTLRLSRTKALHFNIPVEVRDLALQTLPLWIIGIPGLVIAFTGEHGVWLAAFTAVTLAMIVCQRAFSRYHYLPWISLLTLGCGLATDFVLQQAVTVQIVALLVFSTCAFWSLIGLIPFYLRPTDRLTLAQYEKFDQYIYLPYLGKLLQRLLRMRGETSERIFVWGTFSQLYHLTDRPAADNYLHHTIGPWDTPALEGFYDSVIGGLIRHKPAYLIKTFPDLDMDLLEKVTGLQYRLMKVVLARFPVYRLTGFTSVPVNPLALPWQEKMKLMETLTTADWHAPDIDRTDLKRGRANTAYIECRKLLRLNPDDKPGLIFLGELYDHYGQTENAVSAFETAIRKEPGRCYVRLMLAKQKIKLGQIQEAEFLIEEEKKRFGKSEEMLFLSGLIHQHQSRHVEAVVDLDKFRSLHFERPDCWQALIESLATLKEREQLQRLYVESENIVNKPDREWMQTRVAGALAKINAGFRPESETLNYYLQQDPENSLLIYARASALEREGEMENALFLFKKITASQNAYPHIQAGAWFRRARLSRGRQKLQFAKQCLQLDPAHRGAQKFLQGFPAEPSPDKARVQESGPATGSA